MAVRPPVRWAQRREHLLLTFDVNDIKNDHIELTDTKLIFKGQSGESAKTNYALEIEFCEEVTKEGSKWAIHGKATEFVIKKKYAAFWPRLCKTKAKLQWLTIDWSKWVDEDDVTDDIDTSYMDDIGGGGPGGDFNFGGGLGGDDADDDDDDGNLDKTDDVLPKDE